MKRCTFTGCKAQLYPADVRTRSQLYPKAQLYPIDWGVIRRPVVSGGKFVHTTSRAIVKWTARIRCGCLSTRDRLSRHHMVASPACPNCPSPTEDDAHVMAGCPAIGTADWLGNIRDCWKIAIAGLAAPPPPEAWLTTHRLPLLAAMIPASLRPLLALPDPEVARVLRRLHLALATMMAERLRRREALITSAATAVPVAPGAPPTTGLALPCSLPPERQLSPRTLSALEAQRHAASDAAPPPAPPSAARAPPSGEPRQRWLRARLLANLPQRRRHARSPRGPLLRSSSSCSNGWCRSPSPTRLVPG
jgi:hypothetical protein